MRTKKPDSLYGGIGFQPDRMTAPERLDEIASILALGLMRLEAQQSSRLSAVTENSFVDFNPHQSGVAVETCATETAE